MGWIWPAGHSLEIPGLKDGGQFNENAEDYE